MNTPTIDAALDAYRRGWCPVPLRPGQKRPAISSWTALEYGSEQQVRAEFEQAQDQHPEPVNVGLALGEPGGGLLDVDLDHPKASRLASLILPPTPMRTGRPTRPHTHHWYRCAEDPPEGTRRYKLPDGSTLVELRSAGGQTVIPPSTHPDGEEYLWHGAEWGGDAGPREVTGPEIKARVATLAMAATLLDVWPSQGGRHDAYLALAGGLLRYGGVDGETGAVHPLWRSALPDFIRTLADATHDDDGPDTRSYEVMQSTLRRLESGGRVQGWPTLGRIIGEEHTALVREIARDIEGVLGHAQRPALQPVDTALTADQEPWRAEPPESEDDRLERLSALPMEERDPLEERVNAWDAIDLEPYLSMRAVGPKPGVLHRDDGLGLIYPGRLNSLYGASESGKTWLALEAVLREIRAERRAMVIDCEDGPHLLIERLRDLGAQPDEVKDRLAYHNPDMPLSSLMVDRWGHAASSDEGEDNRKALDAVLDLIQPSIIVLDGLTELFNMHALNPNDTSNTARVMGWMKGLTHNGTRTVIMLDHTSKGATNGANPTGSQHKVAMVQGSALHVVAVDKPRRGQLGRSEIFVGKDRIGHIREKLDNEKQPLADVWFDSRTPGRISISISEKSKDHVTVDGEAGAARPKRKPGRPSENHLDADCNLVLEALKSIVGAVRRSEIELAMKRKIPTNRLRDALAELTTRSQITVTGSGPQTRYEVSADRV